jgi:hypothetical protein
VIVVAGLDKDSDSADRTHPVIDSVVSEAALVYDVPVLR